MNKEFLNKNTCGNSVEILKQLEDNSIDLTVTSPPYSKLRDYEGIVNNKIYDEYYSFPFVDMVKELYRTTKDGGLVVWVVNDQVIKGGESGISFRMALKFQELGFKIYDTMIYSKNGAAYRESARYDQVFEYMFVFLKGKKPKTANILKDRRNKWAGSKTFGTPSNRQKDGSIKQMKEGFTVAEYGSRYNIWYVINGKGFGGDSMSYLHPACVDTLTECLTIDGWKKFNEINIGDEILSYNIKSDKLEWDNIKDIHISKYKGNVLNLNSRRLSMLVTENHRNIISSNGKILEKETKDLKLTYNILTSCQNNTNIDSLPREFCYLLGMILTDGYLNKSYIGISQDYIKNEIIVNRVIKCLDKLNLRYTIGKRERYYYYDGEKVLKNMMKIKKSDILNYVDYNTSYDIDIRIWDYKELIKYIPNKMITNLLFKLDKNSLLGIIDGIIDGDGFHRNGYNKKTSNIQDSKSFIVTGKHENFHKNLQILCVLAGLTADYNKIGNYTQITKSRYKNLRNSKDSLIKFEKYEGMVWCPEVLKNGTFIAKRDGKIFITGNSFPESLAEDHILSWSNEGDTILDPMCGGGTTCKMAKKNNRNFIGIDIVENYVDISNLRVDKVVPYTKENPNPKVKFIVSREETLAKRKNKKKTK